MVCVSLEYRRRRQPQQLVGASSSSSTSVETSASQDAAQAVQDAALDDNVAPRSSFHSPAIWHASVLEMTSALLQCDPLLDFSLNACWRHSVL
jgi:hypothetical protein